MLEENWELMKKSLERMNPITMFFDNDKMMTGIGKQYMNELIVLYNERVKEYNDRLDSVDTFSDDVLESFKVKFVELIK